MFSFNGKLFLNKLRLLLFSFLLTTFVFDVKAYISPQIGRLVAKELDLVIGASLEEMTSSGSASGRKIGNFILKTLDEIEKLRQELSFEENEQYKKVRNKIKKVWPLYTIEKYLRARVFASIKIKEYKNDPTFSNENNNLFNHRALATFEQQLRTDSLEPQEYTTRELSNYINILQKTHDSLKNGLSLLIFRAKKAFKFYKKFFEAAIKSPKTEFGSFFGQLVGHKERGGDEASCKLEIKENYKLEMKKYIEKCDALLSFQVLKDTSGSLWEVYEHLLAVNEEIDNLKSIYNKCWMVLFNKPPNLETKNSSFILGWVAKEFKDQTIARNQLAFNDLQKTGLPTFRNFFIDFFQHIADETNSKFNFCDLFTFFLIYHSELNGCYELIVECLYSELALRNKKKKNQQEPATSIRKKDKKSKQEKLAEKNFQSLLANNLNNEKKQNKETEPPKQVVVKKELKLEQELTEKKSDSKQNGGPEKELFTTRSKRQLSDLLKNQFGTTLELENGRYIVFFRKNKYGEKGLFVFDTEHNLYKDSKTTIKEKPNFWLLERSQSPSIQKSDPRHFVLRLALFSQESYFDKGIFFESTDTCSFYQSIRQKYGIKVSDTSPRLIGVFPGFFAEGASAEKLFQEFKKKPEDITNLLKGLTPGCGHLLFEKRNEDYQVRHCFFETEAKGLGN